MRPQWGWANAEAGTWWCYHGGAMQEPVMVERNGTCHACGFCLPCEHIWVHYEAGEDASATLSAPEGTARWSEPVFVCSSCATIQPEAWVENRADADTAREPNR